MVENELLEAQLCSCPDIIHAKVEGDGYHYQILVVSDVFNGRSKVSRQQWVYGKLKEYITSGRLHAVSMKTLTRSEWEQDRG